MPGGEFWVNSGSIIIPSLSLTDLCPCPWLGFLIYFTPAMRSCRRDSDRRRQRRSRQTRETTRRQSVGLGGDKKRLRTVCRYIFDVIFGRLIYNPHTRTLRRFSLQILNQLVNFRLILSSILPEIIMQHRPPKRKWDYYQSPMKYFDLLIDYRSTIKFATDHWKLFSANVDRKSAKSNCGRLRPDSARTEIELIYLGDHRWDFGKAQALRLCDS